MTHSTIEITDSFVPAIHSYAAAFGVTPNHIVTFEISDTDVDVVNDMLMSYIDEVFGGVTVGELRTNTSIGPRDRNSKLITRHIRFVGLQAVVAVSSNSSYGGMTMRVYCHYDEDHRRFMEVLDRVRADYPKKEPKLNSFYMIGANSSGFTLNQCDLGDNEVDVDSQYNDDFKPVSEHILATLSQKQNSKGIVLLHGVYGSGKTTYLRHLISKIPKRVIYLPPNMANQLAEPNFINFLRNYKNSILVIEDAENILRKRMEGYGSAPSVSNLLNLTDGIMGDALNMQVICTFNADLSEIDGALLRPGRLIAKYFFKALTEEKTKLLVKTVHGEDTEPTKPSMTVADIYNMNAPRFNDEEEKPTRGIGFLAGR
jgi:hypothetical protein